MICLVSKVILEERVKDINKQLKEWKAKDYNYKLYYILNIAKILFGQEPSYVSPDNKLVGAYFYDFK